MAEDMIERVARRLWDHSFDRMPDPPWEQTTELQKRFNRMLAREAIAAMREPTDHVREIMNAHASNGMVNWDDYHSAMIDAALAHKQTGEQE